MTWGRDTTSKGSDKVVPIGLHQWRIHPVLGTVIPTENRDTVAHLYNSFNNTDGYNGEYSYLGNLASPRLSRIFMNRTDDSAPFLFLTPLSFSYQGIGNLMFTNTLSPITNLSYHSCGTDQNGEDRVRAYFSSNINKVSGFGFKLDYLYGRGYYSSSQNAHFNADLFGYYQGERYNLHAWVGAGHQKNSENGGIEDDRYIHDPQSFPQRYGSNDIPVLVNNVYNRNDHQNYHLTHKYNLGYYREVEIPDSLKPQMPADSELLLSVNDSLRKVMANDTIQRTLVLDSLHNLWESSQLKPMEFIPVAAFFHTLSVSHLNHFHYEGKQTPASYYSYNYYGTTKSMRDRTSGLRVRNTLGIAMQEGFKKWVKMGITAYAAHEYQSYGMPRLYHNGKLLTGILTDAEGKPDKPDSVAWGNYRRNNIMVGGQISKRDGKMFHYDVQGEITLIGENIGDFFVDGNADFNVGISQKDTLSLQAHAYIKDLDPDPYLQRFHSRFTWWDNSMSKEFRTRIEGGLQNKRSRTSLHVGVENITNYAYLGMKNTLLDGKSPESVKNTDYSHAVEASQYNGSIQVFSASLKQDLVLGPLNWENEITYQTSTKEDVLPLPKLNVYSNLYLLFRIAKVLRVEIGGDIRYFTNYYAPDYAPSIGQFAVQDSRNPRLKCGNYPIINAYANLHIKHCRLYFALNHVNAGTGRMFLAPHYPINPMTIHWGVSWNFFN